MQIVIRPKKYFGSRVTRAILDGSRHRGRGFILLLAVIMIGTNNLTCCPHQTDEDIAKGIEAVVKAARVKSPDSQVVLMNVWPRDFDPNTELRRRIKNINEKIAWLADHPTRCLNRVTLLDIGGQFLDQDGRIRKDLMPDGLHTNASGYEIWADAIEPLIE